MTSPQYIEEYKDIPDISEEEYQHLKSQKKKDVLDRSMMQKYLFQFLIYEEDIEPLALNSVWELFNKPDGLKRIFNIHMEKIILVNANPKATLRILEVVAARLSKKSKKGEEKIPYESIPEINRDQYEKLKAKTTQDSLDKATIEKYLYQSGIVAWDCIPLTLANNYRLKEIWDLFHKHDGVMDIFLETCQKASERFIGNLTNLMESLEIEK